MDRPSYRASPADEIDEDHDNGDHQKNMNKATEGVGSDEPEEPQYKQNIRDRIEHGMHLFVIRVSGCWLTYQKRSQVRPDPGGGSILQSTNRRAGQCASRLDRSLDGF